MAKVNDDDTVQYPVRTKNGALLTEKDVEALAAEAEAGYDLSKATWVRAGRPPLGHRGTSPRIAFRASPELDAAARRRAKAEGKSVSALAREAVQRYVQGGGTEG